MRSAGQLTLYIGADADSDLATTAIQQAGLDHLIVQCTPGTCDFRTPMLISSLGVFDGLRSIVWFIDVEKKSGLLEIYNQ